MAKRPRVDHQHENVTRTSDTVDRRIVSPLKLLLRTIELRDLLSFLQRIKVRFTLRGRHKGERDRERSAANPYHYEARIMVQSFAEGNRTLRTYKAGGKTAAHALSDALAEFLALEEFDFHAYAIGQVSDLELDGLHIDADDDLPDDNDGHAEGK